ncbi:MAG TPA: xanthine dehydrogenase family protein subunit M [Thermoanaerobaculia bacterium]|nr:xanthine dehydrogenase family protein subunit M [Thermoanaerobaculia bacterium]
MKPPPFDYVAPESVDDVLAALAAHGPEAKVLAGGQSLIPLLNFRLARPAVLVDLNRVAELDFVRETAAGGLALGALCRLRRLERDPAIARRAPLLTEATPWIAHPQIRNRGTVGGSLAHADPAAELPVLAVALGARVRLVRRGAERWLPAKDFFVGLLTTALEPEELLAEVELPPLAPGTGWSFLEVARRHGDYAQAGVAALVRLDAEGICREARWVYLSAGEGPVEAREAAAMLVGERWTPERVVAAATHAAEREIDPTSDIHATAAFKRHLAGVLTRRALDRAAERSRRALREAPL